MTDEAQGLCDRGPDGDAVASDATPRPARRHRWWRTRWAYGAGAFALLMLGIATRLYGAWASRYITDPDSGVVALMVKHIAEGGPWPVFFYGQAYMGTLEPLFGAMFAVLGHLDGFAVNLGAAIPAILTLPVLLALGRGAGGRAGSLAALAMCAIGPYTYFAFQFVPRGGYTVMLWMAALTMLLSSYTAERLWRRRPVGRWVFPVIGILAGLGWWTNQLVTPILLACALILAAAMRGRILSPNVLWGLLGFAAGSAPFWHWNATHEWQSFAMGEGLRVYPLRDMLAQLAGKYVRLQGLDYLPSLLARPTMILYLGPVLLGAAAIPVQLARRRGVPHGFWYASCALLAALANIAFFSCSTFARLNTARYLIPLVPAMAVLAAYAVHACRHSRKLTAGIGAVIALMLCAQIPILGHLHTRANAIPAAQTRDRELFGFLNEEGIDSVYTHFRYYPLNFKCRERICFTDLRGDRYPPNARKAECSESLAVLGDYGKVSSFLAAGGGHAKRRLVVDYRIDYGFTPPTDGLNEIDTDRWLSATDQDGNDCMRPLADRNMDTSWEGPVNSAASRQWLDIGFKHTETVRMLRIKTDDPHAYPRTLSILYRDATNSTWYVVAPEHAVTDFFWSGNRPYWAGRRQRLEYRFHDVRATAIRILATQGPRDPSVPWTVSDLQCFGPGPDAPAESNAIRTLRDFIQQNGIRSVYADRWVSNKLYEEFRNTVRLELAPVAFPGRTFASRGIVEWDPGIAFVVRPYDADTTRATFARHAIPVEQTNLGAWIVFTLPDGQWRDALVSHPPTICWTGWNCLDGNTRQMAMARMGFAADLRRQGGQPGAALQAVEDAAALYPDAITVNGDLIQWLAETTPGPRADALVHLYDERAVPPIVTVAEFRDAISLNGISVAPQRVTPGARLTVTYYWRCPALAVHTRWVAFVHFTGNGFVFQDDHHLLEACHGENTPGSPGENELLRETRRVTVPPNTPPGSYTMELGLYNTQTAARSRVKTHLPTHRNAVRLPVTIEVTNAE